MMQALQVFAGSHALQHIQNHGLQASDISMMLAASGGPKWFVLESIDRYLLENWFADRQQPLHLLGTSAGAWRMACYAQNNPVAAIQRFLESYLEQQYSAKPTRAEISQKVSGMVVDLLGSQGVQEILQHPSMRFNTIVARSRGLGAAEHSALQGISLVGALLGNLVSPNAMRPFVERVLFHTSEQLPIAQFPYLPVRNVALNERNLSAAIRASGSIPLVIDGVRNIADAPKGTYRDGGLTDYQFSLPCKPKQGLVLYPHYSAMPPKAVWFDKGLSWRKAKRDHYSHTIILAPSAPFVAGLPGGGIPERKDFQRVPDYATRRQQWQQSVLEMQRMGDELAEIDQNNRWAEVVQPLPW